MIKGRDIWYESHNSLQLYACDYYPENPAATVLCMPGLTRNGKDFEPVVELLANNYRVITVDLRGRGKSQWDPAPANYQPLSYVQDMFVLLDKLQLNEVVLLGTSLGGLMAMLMAAMHPEKITAMILNDIAPEINPEGLARIKSYVGKSEPAKNWAQAMAQARRLNQREFPDLSEQQWLDFVRRLYREDSTGRPVLDYDPAISQPMAGDDDAVAPALWEVFQQISEKPMLLIRGALSDILTEAIVDKVIKKKPDVNYCCLENRGHTPLLSEPKAQRAIEQFLLALA